MGLYGRGAGLWIVSSWSSETMLLPIMLVLVSVSE